MQRMKNLGLNILDCFEALGAMACILLALPLVALRRLGQVKLLWGYIRFLTPHQLLGTAMRVELDMVLKNYERAAAVLNHLVRVIEEDSRSLEERPRYKNMLTQLYSRLFRLYLLSCNIEAATLLLIRAHNHLGIPCLPEYPDYDLRTAHVVKAGLAAGRLLEEGGLATLMVRQGEEPIVGGTTQKPSHPKSQRILKPVKLKPAKDQPGKVIPFPQL